MKHILAMLLWAAAVPAAAQTVCAPLSMPFSEDFDNHVYRVRVTR
ncbi:MAG: hypothetical protein SPL12_06465 [Bacteroidales bacterium]|nr:hypothetical protein [Bacteroidales bacterium]